MITILLIVSIAVFIYLLYVLIKTGEILIVRREA